MPRESPKILVDITGFGYQKLTFNHKPNLDCTDKLGKDSQCLQKFFDKRALKNQDAHLGMTYIITYKKKPIGYVTLATANINKDAIFSKARPSTRDGALFPAMIILDFCIDKKSRGKTYGEYVLMWCNGLARTVSEKIGCRFIILYTKDPDAIRFYTKHNYQFAEGNQNDKFKLMYYDLFPELLKITI